jgi:hypothetical protein
MVAAMFHARGVSQLDQHGLLGVVDFMGASAIPRNIALEQFFPGASAPHIHALLHVCRSPPQFCQLGPPGRRVYHIETFRARAPPRITEPWVN